MAARRSAVPTAVVTSGRTALAGNQKRAEALLARIGKLKTTIGRSFYDLGLALKELHDEKLHVALGLRSFDALLDARVGIAHLVRYAVAEHDDVESVAKRPLAKRPLAKRGTRAIEAATRKVSAKAGPARRQAEIAAKQLEHRLERAGADARVAVHGRGKTWRILIDLAVADAMLVATKG